MSHDGAYAQRDPAVGQVWSTVTRGGIRYSVEIERIEMVGMEKRAFCRVLNTEKALRFTFRTSVFSKRRRGSRLERDADGSVPYKAPPLKPKALVENTKTASDYRRVTAPKGTVNQVSQQQRDAAKAYLEDGATPADLATRFGVSRGTINRWIQNVTNREAEARWLKAT